MSRYKELILYIRKFNKVIVAFSGGVDSYLVLKASMDSLGQENVLAVTAESPSLKQSEKTQTVSLANAISAKHRIIQTEEVENPDYYNNPNNRCFFCKDELYTKLDELKIELGFDNILDGTNYDDMSDYRPGYKASKNHGIHSPLVDLKFTKKEIREMSHELGLEIWDKPSSPCLSSRIPYGQVVTREKLRMIEQAEEIVKQFGFREFRVRHFEIDQNGNGKIKLAKLDIAKDELDRLLEDSDTSEKINAMLREIGYTYVAIDLAGLKSGSLNAGIKKAELE